MLIYIPQWIEVFDAEGKKAAFYSRTGSCVRLCSNKINQNIDIILILVSLSCQKLLNFHYLVSEIFLIFNTHQTIELYRILPNFIV